VEGAARRKSHSRQQASADGCRMKKEYAFFFWITIGAGEDWPGLQSES